MYLFGPTSSKLRHACKQIWKRPEKCTQWFFILKNWPVYKVGRIVQNIELVAQCNLQVSYFIHFLQNNYQN